MLMLYPLCYAAALKILVYYAQYHAQEQELCYISQNFRKTVVLGSILNGIKIYKLYYLMTVLLECIDRLLKLA